MRCLADVSMNLHPKCLARSRPSVNNNDQQDVATSSSVVITEGTGEGCVLGRLRTVHPDLTLVLQVALIGDQDNWKAILVLDSQDLLVEGADFFKRVPGGDGVYEQESLARAHVLFPHSPASQATADQHPFQRRERGCHMFITLYSPVLFLTSGVENIKKGDLIINDTLFSVRIFFRVGRH